VAEVHPSAIVYPGTILGEGVKVLEGAVVGKQPTLSPRSTAKREPLRLECAHFHELVAAGPGGHKEAHDGLAVVRALEALQRTLEAVPA
jgi:hypothetical protein